MARDPPVPVQATTYQQWLAEKPKPVKGGQIELMTQDPATEKGAYFTRR